METPLAAPSSIAGRAYDLGVRWREDLLIGSVLFLAYLALSAYLLFAKDLQPGDALARMVSAYLVFRGHQTKLATIGFVWPPIPTLLILPFALIPTLVYTFLAVTIVSALFTALACLLVGRIAAACGVPTGWRRLLVVLFATNPLIVVFAVNGYSEAILIALLLAGVYWLIRFWQAERNSSMIMAGILFSLLPLVRYEMALVTAGTGLVLIVHDWWLHARRIPPEEFRFLLEGRVLAYSSLAIYPTFLWVLANWQIMGNPLYFLANDRSALSVAEAQITGIDTHSLAAFELAFRLWVAAFPAGLLASLLAVAVGVRRRSAFLVGLALLVFIVPLLQGLLLSKRSTVPLVRYFITVIPFGFAVALAALSPVLLGQREASGRLTRRHHALLAAFAILFLASNVSTGVLLKTSERYQTVEHLTWIAMTTESKGNHPHITDALAVGRVLAQIVPAGSKVLFDEYGFGYAVVLGAREAKLFVDHTHPQFKEALHSPQEFVDYVLVRNLEGAGRLNEVNRAHPSLYELGAPWAEAVEGLPPSIDGWRLYQVRRARQ